MASLSSHPQEDGTAANPYVLSNPVTPALPAFPRVTNTYGSYQDANIPFPRTSGARFCGTGEWPSQLLQALGALSDLWLSRDERSYLQPCQSYMQVLLQWELRSLPQVPWCISLVPRLCIAHSLPQNQLPGTSFFSLYKYQQHSPDIPFCWHESHQCYIAMSWGSWH